MPADVTNPFDTRAIDAVCLGCGYPLRGLERNRCPECGRSFNPEDPLTMNLGLSMGNLARRCLKPAGALLKTSTLLIPLLYVLCYRFRYHMTLETWAWIHDHLWPALANAISQTEVMGVWLWVLLLLAWGGRIFARWIVVRKYRQPSTFLNVDRRWRRVCCLLFF